MSSLLERLGRKPSPVESKQNMEDDQQQEKLNSKIDSSLISNDNLDSNLKMQLDNKENLSTDLDNNKSVNSSQDLELNSKLELLSKLNNDIDLNKALELLSTLSLQLNKNPKFTSNTNANNNSIKTNQDSDLTLDNRAAVNKKSEINLNKDVEETQHSKLGKVVDLNAKTELGLNKGEETSSKFNLKSNLGKVVDLNAKADLNLGENTKMNEKIDLNIEKDVATKPNKQLGLGSRVGFNMEANINSGSMLNESLNQLPNNSLNQVKRKNSYSLLNTNQDQYQSLKLKIHRRIVEELSVEQQKVITNSSSDRMELEKIIANLCNKVIDEDNAFLIPRAERENIINDIIDEVLGLGPIEPLLKDETVSEIMINGPKMVYVERKGKLSLTNVQFQDESHLMNIVERIVSPLGRRIDESSPLVDARLADGSRVNIIIPPLALNGACVTIRKFAKDPLTINNLISFGTLSEDMASLIKSCVAGKLNIVVSGGTGSGKTTTLNVLSSFIPVDERIVTIEDAAELQLRQEHVVTLESRPANVEGNGQIAIRDLVRNALRMRPDRIVVGEVRSGEALDMLQAMNTGHDGSLTTAHANSPRDVLSRLETMVLMAGMELPVKAIREQIASAIDLIIQQSRLRDGSRKITYITEVQGMEGDVIVLQDLFYFEQNGLDENGKIKGAFKTSGIRPKFLEKLETNGIELDCSMFLGDTGWGD